MNHQKMALDPRGSADDVRVSREDLQGYVREIFSATGCGEREAGLIAEHLVLANLLGHDSHGVSLIKLYVRMVREGKINLDQRVSQVMDAGTLLTLDASRGFGQALGHEAMQIGIERARQQGSVILALRNSHHLARIGHWAEMCAEAGLVSIHFVNVLHAVPTVAPYAGSDARLNTNPFAIGVPRADKPPMILDFATSRVAQGKMRIAMNRGVQAPEGYLLDASGQPSVDPSVVYRSPLGALLPFGEHKGAGLGFMCDMLAGALSGAGTLHEGHMEQDVYINNMLSIIIDPQRLGGMENWCSEVEAGAAYVKASPPREGMGPVLVPGELEQSVAQQRRVHGIPVDRETWQSILDAAQQVGVGLPSFV
ncbi:malate/lactate/ureidoglycolate dehydrogenase [Pseudomonas poae]|nr:malate/lactate/ureidoglycolate dehydrogenase [Pseudomonas poae]